MSALALEMQKVSKRLDATQALNGISIALHKGELHALVGRNGAGKSILIEIMAGIHPPDQRAGAEVVA
jgi:ABC-type sugar transport system ATPase subunit